MAYNKGITMKRKANAVAKDLRASNSPYHMKVEPNKKKKVDRTKLKYFDIK